MDKLIFKRAALPPSDEEPKTFSIRIEQTIFDKITEAAKIAKRSRNNLINFFLDFSLERYNITLDRCKKIPYVKSKTISRKKTPVPIFFKQLQPKIYTTFSVYMAPSKCKRIEEISLQTKLSRNKVICCLIQFGLEQWDVK